MTLHEPNIPAPRELTDHVAYPGENTLDIHVEDAPGPGGASHRYRIKASKFVSGTPVNTENLILFQNGPIPINGVNGITQEVLLAIVIDRLRGFQGGTLACRENAIALTHCEDALLWLHKRTRDRRIRMVEGELKP